MRIWKSGNPLRYVKSLLLISPLDLLSDSLRQKIKWSWDEPPPEFWLCEDGPKLISALIRDGGIVSLILLLEVGIILGMTISTMFFLPVIIITYGRFTTSSEFSKDTRKVQMHKILKFFYGAFKSDRYASCFGFGIAGILSLTGISSIISIFFLTNALTKIISRQNHGFRKIHKFYWNKINRWLYFIYLTIPAIIILGLSAMTIVAVVNIPLSLTFSLIFMSLPLSLPYLSYVLFGLYSMLESSNSAGLASNAQDSELSQISAYLFEIDGYFVTIDKKLSRYETEIVTNLMHEMELEVDQRNQARALFHQGKRVSENHVLTLVDKLKDQCHEIPAVFNILMILLMKVAYLSEDKATPTAENMTDAEQKMIIKVATKLDVKLTLIHAILQLQNTSTDLQAAYGVIGVSADASDNEISKAYHKLQKAYHPDTLQAKGLPKEILVFSNQLSKVVNSAYSLIKKHNTSSGRDRSSSQGRSSGRGSRPSGSDRPKTGKELSQISAYLFEIGGYFVTIDGKVSRHGSEVIKNVMNEMELDKDQRRQARDLFRRGKQASEGHVLSLASSLKNQCHEIPAVFNILMILLMKVAYLGEDKATPTAENMTDVERKMIIKLATKLDVELTLIHAILQLQNTSTDLQAAYGVIGVSADASDNEISKAYHKLQKAYHPDTLQAKGLPKEMLVFSNQLSKVVNSAYSLIKKHNTSSGQGRSLNQDRSSGRGSRSPDSTSAHPKLEKISDYLFVISGYFATIGRKTSEHEDEVITYLTETMKLEKDQRRQAEDLFRQGKQVSEDYVFIQVDKLKDQCQEMPAVFSILLMVLTQIAYSGKNKTDFIKNETQSEKNMIEKISKHLNLIHETVSGISAIACLELGGGKTPDAETAYKVIGIPENISKDKISTAFRRLQKNYHLDTLKRKGFPKEMLVFSEKLSMAVNGAYTWLKKNHREP